MEYIHIVIGYLQGKQEIIIATKDIEKANEAKAEFKKNCYDYLDVDVISRPII